MKSTFAAALVAAALAAPVGAANYTLLPDYTQVVFRYVHLGFSSPGAQIAQGAGTLMIDEMHPEMSSVTAEFPLSSLHTGVPELDEHLLSADFFDAEKFPTARFASTKVSKAMGKNHFKVAGELTLHGVTRPAVLEVTLVKQGLNPRTNLQSMGFDAKLTVMRSEFGLGRFVPIVSDAVEMRITSEAAESESYAALLEKEKAAH